MSASELDEFNSAVSQSFKALHSKARSETEIRNILTRKKYSDETVEKVVSYLQERNYISDLKYAQSLVEATKRKKPSSQSLIRQELENKGLNKDIIDSALRDWDEQKDTDAAISALSKKWHKSDANAVDIKLMRQWFSFLARRGFNEDVIRQAINAFSGEDISDMF